MSFLLHAPAFAISLLQSPDGSGYWTAMKHRHLVLAYVITWAGQLTYLFWTLVKRKRTRSL